MVYSVSEYLDMMAAADRAPGTIRGYQYIFQSFARFLGVPVEEIHNHLSPENLIKYAGSMKGYAGVTVRQRLAILRAYYRENGVEFRGLRAKVLNARRRSDPEDKPLTLETLQKMMDITDERGRAFITFMISTGMRPGEAAQIRLEDVAGDVVTIPGSIAKNKRGGKVYLTGEAREYLDIWIRNRDAFIRRASIHTLALIRGGRKGSPRADHDDRLFASGYTGLNALFKRLYMKVDGERGRYRRKITPHSCRKYFRTNAVKTMDLDLVEKLMRHSGYLTGSYVRITQEEARKQFHAGEAALYITRRDQRATDTRIALLKEEGRATKLMEERVLLLEKHIKALMRKE